MNMRYDGVHKGEIISLRIQRNALDLVLIQETVRFNVKNETFQLS